MPRPSAAEALARIWPGLVAVRVIAAGALADRLITSVTVSVAGTPNVRILQAATEGEDFDTVLREWKASTPSAPPWML
ncbi:hypothetical protein GCM10023196_060450 [Actinoallomurus vinaceus]|uniref:Uncharacterized protein n=1 Tax=Actinoallomurus vinaceus TaxID=1080074 RepID=A0ABP8UHD9_9ACTN